MGVAMDAGTASAAVQKIVELLTDPELPVRIFATTSLAAVLEDDSVKLMLQPHVNMLLNALFAVIQQVVNEETMATLAKVINEFPDQTRPQAVMLIQGKCLFAVCVCACVFVCVRARVCLSVCLSLFSSSCPSKVSSPCGPASLTPQLSIPATTTNPFSACKLACPASTKSWIS